MNTHPSVLAMVLAGGVGARLRPLTDDRAKPAVPFGGQYRLIDFALSSLVNSNLCRILVLTQYKSHSLDRHLALTWHLSPLRGNYVTPVPAQMRDGARWFSGSADAVFQNLNLLRDEDPDYIVLLSSDHIYRMDVRQLLTRHCEAGAGVTIATLPVPIDSAHRYGVFECCSDGSICDFYEKPSRVPSIPKRPQLALASMGIYVFTRSVLEEAVLEDHESTCSTHDIGRDLIPKLVRSGCAQVSNFIENSLPGQADRERGYWRDVGTIDSYYGASVDLLGPTPAFDLDNDSWPVHSWQPPLPPARFHEFGGSRSQIQNSLISKGVVIDGGTVKNSILSPKVAVHRGAMIEDSILFEGVVVGRGATVRRAIVYKRVNIPQYYQIGVDLDQDRNCFPVSAQGVTVIGKSWKLRDRALATSQ